jgi:dTDP-glucose 4,6-dehydratase
MTKKWSDQHVLVTGAGGFIGSHLVERLVSEGAKVRAFVRYNSRADIGLIRFLSPETLQQVEIVAGDLRDEETVRQCVKGCQMVYHLGALISIPYSYRHPAEVAQVNFMGTLNLLMACRDLRVERLIHTSTSEVYGTARYAPIDEGHPLQGQSPYSASKIGADKLAESFFCAYNLPVLTVRPFNTYGPRQSARAVIPTIITQVLTQSTLHLGNLDAIRDFTYISDTVDGFIKAGVAQNVEGKTLNLGTGEETTIGDLAHQVIQCIGKEVKIEVDPQRLRPERSEVMRLISNNSLAREQLGWTPSVSLAQGLELTIRWIRDHLDQYRVGIYEF